MAVEEKNICGWQKNNNNNKKNTYGDTQEIVILIVSCLCFCVAGDENVLVLNFFAERKSANLK